ncbi:MAG: hypothetical protein JRG92_23270 [Deltaproteobacteria bacterium]|nr:hypothetical protein [Deltaproteobacteria bacterium]
MTWPDVAVMGLYAGLLLWIGQRATRGGLDASELMLGGRRLPAWAVLCSMVATELSAATFIGVPHAAYTGDWSYLQLAVGALIAKGILARWVIPLYHRAGVVTVYGFLALRFGERPRRVAALGFIGGRVMASGVRLFIAALALSAVSNVPIVPAIVGCGVLAGIYTVLGGIRAVVWTDVLQGALFVVAAVAILIALALQTAGGLGAIFEWASEHERNRVLYADPLFSLGDGRAFGVALIGAFFLTLATHATDHDMVQRLLTTRDARGAGGALLGSALLNFPLSLVFLCIGTGLAHFYLTDPGYAIDDHARILPLFALHELPSGLRGLVFAGLFAAAMSSLDSAICAIATTWVSDVHAQPRTRIDPARRMRRASVVFCAILIAAALSMAGYHAALLRSGAGAGFSLVDFALSSMTVLYGALLGIFALGLLTRTRGSQRSVLVAAALGAATGVGLFLHPIILGRTHIAWPWWIPISAALTFAVAALGRTLDSDRALSNRGDEAYDRARRAARAAEQEPQA